MKNKTLSEISNKVLNLKFRNFTNINGENVFIGKQRKEKGRLPILIKVCMCVSRKGKKETDTIVKGIGDVKNQNQSNANPRNTIAKGIGAVKGRRGEDRTKKKARDGSDQMQRQKSKKRKKRKLQNNSQQKKFIGRKQKKIVVTLQYILESVE